MEHYVILRYNKSYNCWNFYEYFKPKFLAIKQIKALREVFPFDTFRLVAFNDSDEVKV